MRRREFIAGMGAAAATSVSFPLTARAQERVRLVGALTGVENVAAAQSRFAAFVQALAQLGWTDGRNVRIVSRWGGGDAGVIRKHAAELAALKPDVIMVTGGASMTQMLAVTRTVPIVFAIVPDPVGSGYVESLSRPGGNATGFMQFEYSLAGKWLELLKQIAPGTTRAAILWDPSFSAGIGQFAVIQAVAPSLGVEVFPIDARDGRELERRITAFAGTAGGGLIVSANPSGVVHRDLIITLAARHKLPAIYSSRESVDVGGLLSYAANFTDQFRRAAGYVDRVLKGEKPADLPVQAPTKYELVINLKTAKALGLTVPPTLVARADEVIE